MTEIAAPPLFREAYRDFTHGMTRHFGQEAIDSSDGTPPSALTKCLVATHHWNMVKSAIADHAWRFSALA
ncbi:hypothetical protein, partial [Sphingobium sp.]|uniref:hypothetical protein n=1 Tax=Sphingobium sp. TaxID=1912891 RepID=UPI0028BEF1AF